MLKIDFSYMLNSPDGLAFSQIHKYFFKKHNYVILDGLTVTADNGLSVKVSKGLAYIISRTTIIENDNLETIDLNEINSQPSDFATIPDGHHVLMICYNFKNQDVYFYLVLELEPGKWDNPATSDYVVLSILEVNGGNIINQYDEYDKWKRIDMFSGGSGIGTLTIKDEDVVISSDINTLNFKGVDVLASLDFANPNQVNIFIPPPLYASHFNTNDGTTNTIVSPIPTTNRHVAKPTNEGDPYSIGDWTPGNIYPCINNPNLNYSTPEEFSCKTNNTTLDVIIYDANGNELVSSTTTLNGNQTNNQNGITTTVSNFSTDYDQYKCKVDISVDLNQIIPHGGRFSIKIIHHDDVDGSFVFQQNDIFYDSNENEATLSGVTINETSGYINTIQISGVYYYTLNSQFTIDINDIDWLNDRSYPTVQVRVLADDIGLPPLNLQGNDLTNWVNNWNDIDDSYHKEDWSISQTNHCFVGETNAIAYTIDWTNGNIENSNSLSLCVNTYNENATRILEDFRLETYRLTSDFNSWDSTQNLLTYDNGNGLQVRCSRLVYPTENFQLYLPNSSLQPDYSSASGNRYYYRRMWHDNVSHSNGRFRLSDHNITEDDLTNHDVEIWISLDGINWYSVNDDYLGGALNDGDGCRVNKDQYNLNTNNEIAFTFGLNKYTDASTGGGWGMYIKIIYKDNVVGRSKYLGQISEVTWI